MGEGERAERPERAESLAGIDWGDVFAEAVALAHSGSFVKKRDIDDVVSEGISRLYEGSATYDPEVDGELAMRVIVVGKLAIRATSKRLQRRASGDFENQVGFEARVNAPPGPEESLAEAELREEKAEILRQVKADCAGDGDALAVVDCALLSIERPEDQARVTGLSYGNVRSAVKRVKRRLERLLKGEETEVADE
jgi:DNA-directed RNA polymerase specialized sigma24 family protein